MLTILLLFYLFSARSIRSSSTQTITSQGSYDPPAQQSPAKTKPGRAALDEYSSRTSDSTEDGRVQTPELAASPVTHRHHLDVTTPNRHGMVLSSPPHKSRTYQYEARTAEPAPTSQGDHALIEVLFNFLSLCFVATGYTLFIAVS